MEATELKERITNYANEFDSYCKQAQGMQMMLVMCIKAGMPMPSQEEVAAAFKKEQPNKTA